MHISFFGIVIKKLRLERDFTQEKLASVSVLERTFVSMLERGVKQPSLKTISSLATALNLKVYELLHMVEQEIHLANSTLNCYQEIEDDQRRLDKLELEQENSRIGEIANSMPIVFFARQPMPEYTLTFVSRNIRQLSGYDMDHFMNNHEFWQQHIHPDDLPKVLDCLSGMNASEILHHEYRFLTRNGQWLSVREELKLVVDETGIPKEVIGLVEAAQQQ